MKLNSPQQKPYSENDLIPMINVVFLLLVFFMVAGTIDPPVPIDTVPPDSTQRRELSALRTLHIASDGSMALDADAVTLASLDSALRHSSSELSNYRGNELFSGEVNPAANDKHSGSSLNYLPDSVDDSNRITNEMLSSLAVRADGNLTVDQLHPVLNSLRDAGIARIELVTTWAPVEDL